MSEALTLRSFRNTDTDTVCGLWNGHFGELDQVTPMDPLAFELSILSKPQFQPENLIIAERSGEPKGFALLCFEHPENVNEAMIAALAVPASEDDATTAAILLDHADTLIRESSVAHSTFRPALPSLPYALGYGPGDSLIGATSAETRLCGWLAAAGYQPWQPTSLWQLELNRFSPVVSRAQIQIRRSTQTQRLVDEPELSWWQACILGHTEPFAFQLSHRADRRITDEVLFWSVAAELKAWYEDYAWLWPPTVREDDIDGDSMLFLMSESLRELSTEGLDAVRTVTSADQKSIIHCLQRLGFQSIESGFVFRKDL